MDPYERTHLCDGLKELKVKAGETVITEVKYFVIFLKIMFIHNSLYYSSKAYRYPTKKQSAHEHTEPGPNYIYILKLAHLGAAFGGENSN